MTKEGNRTADHGEQLDIPTALSANVNRGANQGTLPAPSVRAVLLLAGVDPTRATWTKATWANSTWTCTTCTGALGAVEPLVLEPLLVEQEHLVGSARMVSHERVAWGSKGRP